MPRILQRVLKILDQIYEFPGGEPSAPQEADTVLPLQFIHDVGREAELASQFEFRGFWLGQVAQAHVAAGSIQENLSLDNPSGGVLNGFTFDDVRQWAWLYDAWGEVDDNTDFTDALLAVNAVANKEIGFGDGTAITAGGLGVQHLVKYWDATLEVTGEYYLVDSDTVTPRVNWPVRIPTSAGSGHLIIRSTSGGVNAFTASFSMLVWVGPRGVMPPGLY